MLQPSRLHHKLLCYWYDGQRNPRLLLQPIKVELLYLNPKIYVFHDFLSDKEMDRLKELAGPKVRQNRCQKVVKTCGCGLSICSWHNKLSLRNGTSTGLSPCMCSSSNPLLPYLKSRIYWNWQFCINGLNTRMVLLVVRMQAFTIKWISSKFPTTPPPPPPPPRLKR